MQRNRQLLILLTSDVFDLGRRGPARGTGFATAANSRNILLQVIALAIVAAGQTVVIISGGIDLSIPWMMSVAAILLTYLTGGQDAALVWVVPVIFGVAMLVGLFNGFGVGLLRSIRSS